jgi:hypothetical protein
LGTFVLGGHEDLARSVPDVTDDVADPIDNVTHLDDEVAHLTHGVTGVMGQVGDVIVEAVDINGGIGNVIVEVWDVIDEVTDIIAGTTAWRCRGTRRQAVRVPRPRGNRCKREGAAVATVGEWRHRSGKSGRVRLFGT